MPAAPHTLPHPPPPTPHTSTNPSNTHPTHPSPPGLAWAGIYNPHTPTHPLFSPRRAAAWAISHEYSPPHGPAWERWRAAILAAEPPGALAISRTHDYLAAGATRFRWRCTDEQGGCGREYGRNMKCIDVKKHVCR